MKNAMPVLQEYEEILSDLKMILDARMAIDTANKNAAAVVDELISAALPALCRRFCELVASIGPTHGDMSGNVMLCHANDTNTGIMTLRVFESFPNYGLDRTLDVRGEYWGLHTRQVHYHDPNNPSLNKDVIAEALLARRDGRRRTSKETNTQSESARNIVAVATFIPSPIKMLASLEEVKKGTIVALNIDFYNSAPDTRTSAVETFFRLQKANEVLDEIHALSLLQAMEGPDRKTGILSVLEKIRRSDIVNFTLRELVKYIIHGAG